MKMVSVEQFKSLVDESGWTHVQSITKLKVSEKVSKSPFSRKRKPILEYDIIVRGVVTLESKREDITITHNLPFAGRFDAPESLGFTGVIPPNEWVMTGCQLEPEDGETPNLTDLAWYLPLEFSDIDYELLATHYKEEMGFAQ